MVLIACSWAVSASRDPALVSWIICGDVKLRNQEEKDRARKGRNEGIQRRRSEGIGGGEG
eukprot:760653-Hanusia_phi.AAC.1